MLDDNILHILALIGAFACLGLALLMFCTTVLVCFLIVDGHQARRKSKFGKHQTAGSLLALPNDEDVQHFDQLLQYAREDVDLTDSIYSRAADETVVQAPVLVSVKGWEQEGPRDKDATMVYPFNMKGPDDSRKPRH